MKGLNIKKRMAEIKEMPYDCVIHPSKYDRVGVNTLLEEHNKETLKKWLELP